MNFTWLHVSDFHFRTGDPYDRVVILRAPLVQSVRRFRENGRVPDLIFVTGDLAHSGKDVEYELATRFLDELLDATGLTRSRLFVVPGNHDVDRAKGIGLARTLTSREEADAYFAPDTPKHHLYSKQEAFLSWYNSYFAGIRSLTGTSTCGPVEAVEVPGGRIGLLPINTALFCQDDEDHHKLWIGRRCLDAAMEELKALGTPLSIAILHHPVDWLHPMEGSNIKASLRGIDLLLRGHLHESEAESVASAQGHTVHLAAGAAYQTRKWPNSIMVGDFRARE